MTYADWQQRLKTEHYLFIQERMTIRQIAEVMLLSKSTIGNDLKNRSSTYLTTEECNQIKQAVVENVYNGIRKGGKNSKNKPRKRKRN